MNNGKQHKNFEIDQIRASKSYFLNSENRLVDAARRELEYMINTIHSNTVC